MDRIPVVSSDLASVGYIASAQLLEIEFQSGALYEYRGVPAHIYAGLMSAPSLGKFFNQYIKKGGFPFVRIR